MPKKKKIGKDGDWTYYIKERLGKLGRDKFGYQICTSRFSHCFEPEWLFDLVWYKETGLGFEKTLVDLPLVVESEWNMGFESIRYDFEKLLSSNARHHLMICQAKETSKEMLFEYFSKAINAYQLGKVGDRFLIAMLDFNTEIFDFRVLCRKAV